MTFYVLAVYDRKNHVIRKTGFRELYRAFKEYNNCRESQKTLIEQTYIYRKTDPVNEKIIAIQY